MSVLTAPAREIRTRVFEILTHRGTPVTWLARQMGVSANYLYQIKDGRKPITERFINDSVRILGLPRDVLFTESEPAA